MTVREISMFSNALCEACQRPAAEGAMVDGKLLCRPHAQWVVWSRAEEALWDVLKTFGAWDTLDELVEGVKTHRRDDPIFGYLA